jgi:hypothetical protein
MMRHVRHEVLGPSLDAGKHTFPFHNVQLIRPSSFLKAGMGAAICQGHLQILKLNVRPGHAEANAAHVMQDVNIALAADLLG